MIRMTVESLAMNAVKLLADEVFVLLVCSMSHDCQVLMLDKASWAKQFKDLHPDDKDLTMFTITDLKLKEAMNTNMVYMTLKLKRKIATELLTTYLPTILLLLITFVTIFFDRNLFGDAIAVNLTIMLVMTTTFTSKIEELPPTSDYCESFARRTFTTPKIRTFPTPKFGHFPPPKKTFARRTTATPNLFFFFWRTFLGFFNLQLMEDNKDGKEKVLDEVVMEHIK